MEASVILMRCAKNHSLYGVRIQKMEDGDWWRTWTFPVDEKRAKKEGYDQEKIRGNFYSTEDFPGCPYCKSKSFVKCNKCYKLACWNGEAVIDCPWCGIHMENIVPATEKFDVSGGDI